MITYAQQLLPWWQLPIVVVDFETTGPDPNTCMPIEVAAVRFRGGEIMERASSLINPGVPIPAESTAIHGITDEMVADAPTNIGVTIRSVLGEVGADECVPCGYNGQRFDRIVYHRAIGTEPGEWPWLDPMVLVKAVDRGRARLVDACERRGINVVGAHRAMFDAIATGMVLYSTDIRKVLGNMTISEALRRQLNAAQQQEASYQEWKQRQQAAQ